MASLGGRDRILAAGLLFVAAVLHLAAAFDPEHMEKQLFFGAFWAMMFTQGFVGLLVLRQNLFGASFGIFLNVSLILLFVVTRIVPVPGEITPEPIEALGVATKLVELATLPLLLRILGSKAEEQSLGSETEAI